MSERMEPEENGDASDVRPSFRKPLNDAAGRNYRRHSPVGGSDGSLSGDSPKRVKKSYFSREEHSKIYDKKNRDDSIDLDRDHSKRLQRDSDSHRYSERETYMGSHNRHRRDGYGRDPRDDSERSYYRPSKFSRNSRDCDPSPQRRRGDFERSNEVSQRSDRLYRNRSDYNNKGEERAVDRARKPDEKATTHDRYKDSQIWDDRRERRRSPEDHRSSHRSYDERARIKDSSSRDIDGHDDISNKRKLDRKDYGREHDSNDNDMEEDMRNKNNSSSRQQERQLRNDSAEASQILKELTFPSKNKSDLTEAQALKDSKVASEAENPTTSSKFSSEPSVPSGLAGVTLNHGAATVAAMKAAELVNMNLLGGGLSITEQKKKLLWGNKKNTDESSSHWDLSLIPDPERQEKFKKLMGVKGDLKLETKPDDKDGNLRAKQQEELQLDLEKQYTAGLRRRDGRTVGLGL